MRMAFKDRSQYMAFYLKANYKMKKLSSVSLRQKEIGHYQLRVVESLLWTISR